MNKSAFHDLGYDSEKAFTLELKAKVLSKILQTIKKSGLTQRELSKILDQPQSRISELVKGKLSLMSLETLLEYYKKLGGKVDLKFGKEPVLKRLTTYKKEESISWEELSNTRMKKHSAPGVALRGARIKKGMSLAAVSKKTGIAQNNLSKMENGERPISKTLAKRLSRVLNVDYRVFL